jgi:AraC-like DNA-binding protein
MNARLAKPQSVALLGEFQRQSPDGGFVLPIPGTPLKGSGRGIWISNGGPGRAHPFRSKPFTLEVPVPQFEGQLKYIKLIGVFAQWAQREHEGPGTLGATLLLQAGDEVRFRLDLLNGRHYSDASVIDLEASLSGDGLFRESVGSLAIDDRLVRLDCVTIDIPETGFVDTFKLRDMGSAASFAICEIAFVFEPAAGCPFHSKGGGVSLSELGAVVRIGDRLRLQRAIRQLESSLLREQDLDEARGEALTFIAVLTAATLELGGSREMHRVQLEAARQFDQLETVEDIARAALAVVEQIVAPLFAEPSSPSARLVDRALALVDRNFAKPLNDAEVAEQLGLSTSHFRFLFKEATGQPFHRYLIAMRLEKARKLLIEHGMPVSEAAKAVGFTNASHFSRAFAQRFKVSPTRVRYLPQG